MALQTVSSPLTSAFLLQPYLPEMVGSCQGESQLHVQLVDNQLVPRFHWSASKGQLGRGAKDLLTHH